MFQKRRIVGIAVVVALVVCSLGAGAVMAKSFLNPISEDGVISGAYQKVNGMLRLVNGEEDVRPSEVFIQWNQQGPPGEPGLPGAQGEPGVVDEVTTQEVKDGICMLCNTLGFYDDAPGFCFKIKQEITVNRMRGILTSLEVYLYENNGYPSTLSELNLLEDLQKDGWGNDWVYDRYEENAYSLTSLGYDNEPGPPPPDTWILGDAGESDIIFDSAVGWVQKPGKHKPPGDPEEPED